MLGKNFRLVQFGGDLSRLTTLIGVTIAFFGLVLLAVIAWSGVNANSSAVERERTLVENALDQSIIRVLNEQKSIAWWDDAVTNVALHGVNKEWADVQIGMYLSETYGHAEIYVIDAQDRPVYSYVNGVSSGAAAYSTRSAEFAPLIREVRTGERQFARVRDQAFVASQSAYRELLGARVARWGGHILSLDGKPVVVTAITIVPNLEFSLIQGTPHMMISVVPIDEAFVGDIGRSLLMPDLTIAQTRAQGPESHKTMEPFITDDGTRTGYITWTPRQPGQRTLTVILPLVALGLLLAGYAAFLMIRRLKRASQSLADREAKAQHEAKHDQLSGLPNRRHFIENLQEKLDALVQSRTNGRVVVAYIDVDRFKDVNDTLGHQAGDTLIMQVAARLKKSLSPGDFLARFGGDEFAVMRWSAGPSDASDLTSRLRVAFDDGFDIYGQQVRMTASVGISVAPDHGGSPAELMRHADIALYQGKNQGRDRAMMFSAEMAAEVEQRREIEVELHDALKNNELQLYYQPIVSCGSNRATGLEALLRWKHPTKGHISPGVFVPVAEDSGLMPALGAWVLERAFVDSARWPDLQIAVNLSPVQFRHVDLVGTLERLVAQYNVDASRFVLEVTEGVMLESTDRNRHILDAIRALGFKIALDDFGTGYSSLRYLSDFRFDKIKIDRAFVTDVQERKRALTIVQSVVTLGRGLGMDIVAEGVETQAEASVMRLVGVTELQGYFFSQAVPADDVAALVESFAPMETDVSAAAARVEARLQRFP